MKNPSFQSRSAWLAFAVSLALYASLLAQPTDKPANKSNGRSKPQVIYHLPASSNYAATLHSQAKGQNNAGEENAATPPPVSHENQNVAPPAARQDTAPPSFREPRSQPSKASSHQSARARSVKSKPQGNSKGGKPHKK